MNRNQQYPEKLEDYQTEFMSNSVLMEENSNEFEMELLKMEDSLESIEITNNTNKKSVLKRERIFVWRREGDTLCPHRFDRSERCPKRFAVLETSQSHKAIAPYGLLRRTPLRGSHSLFKILGKKNKPKGSHFVLLRLTFGSLFSFLVSNSR